jgi:hypothetical protein
MAQQPPGAPPAGAPGSPSGTITLDGSQLPAPPQKFGGKIERDAGKSTPYWPARVVPPKGAPNVLLIVTDDSGYGVPSTFGGVICTARQAHLPGPQPKEPAERHKRREAPMISVTRVQRAGRRPSVHEATAPKERPPHTGTVRPSCANHLVTRPRKKPCGLARKSMAQKW